MLPLGRKNARKCSECDITCHAHCAHLVPDFCGMSMETANKLLDDWRQINRIRQDRTPKQHVKQPSLTHVVPPQQPGPGSDTLSQGMERMRIQEPPAPVQQQELPPRQQSPSQDRYGYQQLQPQQPLPGTYPGPHGHQPSRPPGARIPVPPAYPLEHQQAILQQPPPRDDRYGGYDVSCGCQSTSPG